MKARIIWVVSCFLAFSAVGETADLGQGNPVRFSQNSEAIVSGQHVALGIQFSSVLQGTESVAVDIYLKSGKHLKGKIDYATQKYNFRFVHSGTDVLVKLTKADLDELRSLNSTLLKQLPTSDMPRAVDALLSILNLLDEYPPGEYFEISRKTPLSSLAWASLCGRMDQPHTGTYDVVEGTPISETRPVGPCARDGCLGRCGPGCDAPPNPGIQKFTDGCFDHDLCTRATGNILGPCADEWRAAVDDFLLGTDCQSMRGVWQVRQTGRSCFRGQCGTIDAVRTFNMAGGTTITGRSEPHPKDGRRSTIVLRPVSGDVSRISGTWSVPNYMPKCNYKPDGYASGTLTGTNSCGRIETTARGSWGWYYTSTCRSAGRGDFSGTINGTRSDRLSGFSPSGSDEVQQDSAAGGMSLSVP
jgi:hypothetical protein